MLDVEWFIYTWAEWNQVWPCRKIIQEVHFSKDFDSDSIWALQCNSKWGKLKKCMFALCTTCEYKDGKSWKFSHRNGFQGSVTSWSIQLISLLGFFFSPGLSGI